MKLVIYGQKNCPFCEKAVMLCDLYGVDYDYIDITDKQGIKQNFRECGLKTVPQIWVDAHGEQHIGGYTELAEFLEERDDG